jgi:flagellar biosynthesis/type III secretory pathway protein FliH
MGTYCSEETMFSKEPPMFSKGNGWHTGCTFTLQTEGRNMKKTLGGALIAFAFIFGIIATASTTAEAQWSNRSNGGYNNQQVQQGYQYGVNTGASDAQRGQSYSPQRSRYYRDARTQAFREGFVRGYDQAYRQYAGANGNGRYGNRGRNNGNYGGYNNQELNSGYQQGINTGSSDGQSNKSYNPQRSRHYKNASTQAYREGFVRGYDQGYRQYSRNSSYRRSNSAGSILQQILGMP